MNKDNILIFVSYCNCKWLDCNEIKLQQIVLTKRSGFETYLNFWSPNITDTDMNILKDWYIIEIRTHLYSLSTACAEGKSFPGCGVEHITKQNHEWLLLWHFMIICIWIIVGKVTKQRQMWMHVVSLMEERFAKEHAVYPKGQYAFCETKLPSLFSNEK